MTSTEIRNRFINYFVKVLAKENMEHVEVPSSSLIPENHPTLLFTNSGMVQFTPYFLGEKDPVKDFGSKRLCSAQKCIRTGDLDIVGTSKYHQTYFEMLGNWSIGDYGKQKAVEFSFDLLTNKEYGFGLDASKFYPTVFAGNEDAPEDSETIDAWKSVGIAPNRIPKLPVSENWWAPGPVGPCGPCTEVLYDRGPEYGSEEEVPGMTDNPRYLEIWNAGVFMQFNRDQSGKLNPLVNLSVDTGSGLERLCVLLQNVDSNYETDLFREIITETAKLSKTKLNLTDINTKQSLQRVADHIRAASFLIIEGLYPSNKDQGYVLRRLMRRVATECALSLDINIFDLVEITKVVIKLNKDRYPEMDKPNELKEVFENEFKSFNETFTNTKSFIVKNYIKRNLTEINDPFEMYQSLGASKELIAKIAKENNLTVDFTSFDEKLSEHQEQSRSNMSERFKGGLGDHSIETTRLHTATHLLHQALIEVLGDHVGQMGSNITPDRLRFDFSHSEKMTDEQILTVQNLVNKKITEKLPVTKVVLSRDEAEKSGALHFFKEKYGDQVSIYFTGDDLQTAWSKEFCGGPHVTNTGELGQFKIIKEESVAKGIRRVKAVLE